jgi:hypothetical protein
MARTNIAVGENDAKACFDRLHPNIHSIRSQQLGMPKNVCVLFTKMLERFRYYAKTANGVSKACHHHDPPENPVFGLVQGGQAAGPGWQIISSLLLDLVKIKSQGATFTDPRQLETIKRWMEAFVDDTSATVNSFRENLANIDVNLRPLLQETTQWWEQLLHAVGGELELKKCFYFILEWEFDADGFPKIRKQTPNEQPIDITQSSNNQTIPITEQEPTDWYRILGLHTNPSGDQSGEIARLRAKAAEHTNIIKTAHLTSVEAQTYQSVVMATGMKYTMPYTTINNKTLDSIQSPPTNALLSKLGYNRKTPREAIFAPKDMGGEAFKLLRNDQGALKIADIIKYTRQSNTVGKFMKIALDWVQLTCGFEKSFFEDTSTPARHVSSNYFHTARNHLKLINATLLIPGIYQATKRRQHDQLIMQLATTTRMPAKEIERINLCRLFLKVETIADITNTQGTRIQKQAWRGLSTESTSTLLWPRQERPGPLSWRAWRRLLRLITSKTRKLHIPLGAWTNTNHRTWPATYDASTNTVQLISDGVTTQYTVVKRNTRIIKQHQKHDISPHDGTPIEWTGRSAPTPLESERSATETPITLQKHI